MAETEQGILSDDSLRAYWSTFDTSVYSAVNKMNEIDEPWSIDKVPVILKACERLGDQLYNQRVLESATNEGRLLHQDDVKTVLDVISNLQTARGLRIFRWLEQYQPEFSAELVEAATLMQDDRSALVFIERVRVLNKLHLISRIFSYSRLKMIIDKLTDMKSQGAIDHYAREERHQREQQRRQAQARAASEDSAVAETIGAGAMAAVSKIEDLLASKEGAADGSDDSESGSAGDRNTTSEG